MTFPSECKYSITLTDKFKFYVGIEILHQMLSVICAYFKENDINYYYDGWRQ